MDIHGGEAVSKSKVDVVWKDANLSAVAAYGAYGSQSGHTVSVTGPLSGTGTSLAFAYDQTSIGTLQSTYTDNSGTFVLQLQFQFDKVPYANFVKVLFSGDYTVLRHDVTVTKPTNYTDITTETRNTINNVASPAQLIQ